MANPSPELQRATAAWHAAFGRELLDLLRKHAASTTHEKRAVTACLVLFAGVIAREDRHNISGLMDMLVQSYSSHGIDLETMLVETTRMVDAPEPPEHA